MENPRIDEMVADNVRLNERGVKREVDARVSANSRAIDAHSIKMMIVRMAELSGARWVDETWTGAESFEQFEVRCWNKLDDLYADFHYKTRRMANVHRFEIDPSERFELLRLNKLACEIAGSLRVIHEAALIEGLCAEPLDEDRLDKFFSIGY